jgi:hypothetical protein
LNKLAALNVLVIVSHTKMKKEEISGNIVNVNRAVGIIIQVFKPDLVQIHTRITAYKTLA